MDASIMAAGPWTGALLGMLGADVIKIEPPAGDGTRWVMPTQHGMGTNFISMNVNKRDVILDLKAPRDAAVARELIAKGDIFIQNFRVGVAERLGFGWPALQAINPRLVYCAISGFGESGPLASAGCADPIMQAFSGFASANGAIGDAGEAFRFTGFIDLTTANVAVGAILAALNHRDTTGLGQKVSVSMLEAALELQCTRIAELLGAGVVPRPHGSGSPALAPDRAYATADQPVFVTVHDEHEWAGFCAAMELRQALADPRFRTNRARVANRDALDEILEPVFLSRPAIWWLRVLARHGIAAVIAHNFETFRHHRQVVENDMIATLATQWGEVCVGGTPWHFSATSCRVEPPSAPGADNACLPSAPAAESTASRTDAEKAARPC